MSNGVMTIMKKELKRFFGDKRLFFTTVLMPGLMIYVIYSIMGNTMMKEFSTDEDFVGTVAVTNLPAGFDEMFDQIHMEVVDPGDKTIDEVKEEVSDKELNAYVVFPEDFAQIVADASGNGNVGDDPDNNIDTNDGQDIPNIMIYYNSTDTDSSAVHSSILAMLDAYESSVVNLFDVNNPGDTAQVYDLASEEDATGMLFSMMLPFLLLTFIFTGCMSISIDSIAGEKERGTIATLLVTPMKRSHLALGKILSLSIVGLLSGLSSFIGTAMSMPNLMGDAMGEISAGVYSVKDYILLLLIIFSTVLVVVGMIAVVSALCKNIKEASTASTPLMLIVMFIGISSMFSEAGKNPMATFFVPIYNSVISMSEIFSFNYTTSNVVIGIVSNVIISGVLVLVLARIFDSEKIMNS